MLAPDKLGKDTLRLTVAASTVSETPGLVQWLICYEPVVCLPDDRVEVRKVLTTVAVASKLLCQRAHESVADLEVGIAGCVEGLCDANERFFSGEE